MGGAQGVSRRDEEYHPARTPREFGLLGEPTLLDDLRARVTLAREGIEDGDLGLAHAACLRVEHDLDSIAEARPPLQVSRLRAVIGRVFRQGRFRTAEIDRRVLAEEAFELDRRRRMDRGPA